MMEFDILNSSVRHQVFLERLKAGEVKNYEEFLQLVQAYIVEKLAEDELSEYNKTKFNQLLKQIKLDLEDLYGEQAEKVIAFTEEVAQYEAEFEAKNITSNMIEPPSFEQLLPSEQQIKAAIRTNPLPIKGVEGGKLLEPFVKDWGKKESELFINVIRQGFFEGATNKELKQRLIGTKANNYKDGIVQVDRRRAEAIIRTSIQHASTQARVATIEASSKVVKGYKWVSTLDGRTSQICRALDGREFALGKGPRPPAHINCRSTLVPLLKDEYAILSEGRQRAARNVDTNKTERVDANVRYYDWLAKQPKGFQDDVLGKKLGKVFREGGLSAERFQQMQLNNNTLRPLNLEEMRKKEKLAFEKAGVEV